MTTGRTFPWLVAIVAVTAASFFLGVEVGRNKRELSALKGRLETLEMEARSGRREAAGLRKELGRQTLENATLRGKIAGLQSRSSHTAAEFAEGKGQEGEGGDGVRSPRTPMKEKAAVEKRAGARQQDRVAAGEGKTRESPKRDNRLLSNSLTTRRSFAKLSEGDRFPHFVAEDLDGDIIDTRAFVGRTILLMFWGVHCTACIDLLPHLADLHHQIKDRGLTVLGVNEDSPMPVEEVKEFLEGLEFEWGRV